MLSLLCFLPIFRPERGRDSFKAGQVDTVTARKPNSADVGILHWLERINSCVMMELRALSVEAIADRGKLSAAQRWKGVLAR